MEIKLAYILGWEENETYRTNRLDGFIEHKVVGNKLLARINDNEWEETDYSLGLLEWFVKHSIKVEPKKYYLRHKYLDIEQYSYLNYKVMTKDFELNTKCCDGNFQTQFTEEEIKEIEKTGFDLTNFEKIGVEED